MKGFIGLTKRNIMLFFKDRHTVVFSLLTSIIVLVLYLLFLKGSFIDALNSVINQNPGLSELISGDKTNMLVNLFLLTGILGSAMITVPYNCLTTLVKDKENKVDYDILATPVKRWQIVLSYFAAAAISSILLTNLILALGLAVIGTQGKLYMDFIGILKAVGIVTLGSVSATSVFMILVMSFKSTSASGAFFGVLSAASGFVIGAYIPISQFSGSVQTVCNIFPASQVTILLRNMLMNGVLSDIDASLAGIDRGMFVTSVKEIFSFKARFFDSYLDIKDMILYVSVSIGICLIVQMIVFARTYKKK